MMKKVLTETGVEESVKNAETSQSKSTKKGYSLYLRIDGLPKTPNQLLRRHWAIISKERVHWHNAVAAAVRSARPKRPLTKAKLRFVRNSSREPDFDARVGSTKFLCDALIACGIIVDDKFSVIGSPEFEWAKCKPKMGFVEIFVEEV